MIDTLYYLILCGLFAGAGFGALRLLRPQLPAGIRLLLAPCVTQALLAVALGMSVIAGFPLKYVALPIWITVILLAAYGALSLREEWVRRAGEPAVRRRVLMMVGVTVIAAPIVMLPYFVYGLADYPITSGNLDGWSYAAFGQYLWEMPRGTEGGLRPLYQFGAHLSHTRFVAPGQLGLLSALVAPGDTQAASGLLRALSIFVLASGCAAFARMRQLSVPLTCLYVVLSAVSGWVLGVIWAENFDQSLALFCFPALAALATGVAAWGRREAVLTGLLAAAAVYIYPEFALLSLGGAGLIALEAALRRRTLGRAVLLGAVTLLVMIVVVSPYLRDLQTFFVAQLNVGMQTTGGRPGSAYFLGLLDPHEQLSALVAFGGERSTPSVPFLRNLLAGGVLLVMIVGIVRLAWRREVALVLILCGLMAMIGVLVWKQQYGYGAYKALSLGWWAFSFALISGVGWLPQQIAGHRRLAWVATCAIVLISPAVTAARAISDATNAPAERISDYRAVERLPQLIGQTPLLLDVADVWAEHWAVYYLRQSDLLLGLRSGYLAMPHLAVLMDRSRPVAPASVRYVVTDGTLSATQRSAGWRLVWARGRLAAWDTAPQGWAAINGIRDAVGNVVGPQAYVFSGPPGVTLNVLASRSGTIALSGRLSNIYPDSERPCWRLRVSTAPATSPPLDLLVTLGAVSVTVPVAAGASAITVQATPTSPTPHTGTPDVSRESGLFDLHPVLLPTTAAPSGPADGHAATPLACAAS